MPSLRVFSRRVIEQSRKSRSIFLSRYSCRKEKQKRRKNFSSSSHNLVENLARERRGRQIPPSNIINTRVYAHSLFERLSLYFSSNFPVSHAHTPLVASSSSPSERTRSPKISFRIPTNRGDVRYETTSRIRDLLFSSSASRKSKGGRKGSFVSPRSCIVRKVTGVKIDRNSWKPN